MPRTFAAPAKRSSRRLTCDTLELAIASPTLQNSNDYQTYDKQGGRVTIAGTDVAVRSVATTTRSNMFTSFVVGTIHPYGDVKLGNARVLAAVAPTPRLEQFGNRPLATPAADVYENDRELLFVFDVPGGSRDGATVVWNERDGLKVLVRSQGLPHGRRWASEYEPADWCRAFTLPDYAEGSKATSTITNGVLSVRVPKRGTASRARNTPRSSRPSWTAGGPLRWRVAC